MRTKPPRRYPPHMSRMIPFLVLVIVLAACSSDDGSVTATSSAVPASAVTTSTTEATTPAPTSTTATTEALDPIEAALRVEIAELVEVTEQVRGLEFKEDPTITILSPEELADRVREDLSEELVPEDLAPSEALMHALGIMDPATGLLNLYLELYSEQVGGFYDLETKELVVPAGEALTGLQKMTVVHELTHALTDQHFDISTTIFALDDADLYEESTAMRALVEGDATWAQLIYFQTVMSSEDRSDAIAESLSTPTEVLDRTPDFLADLLLFPYSTEDGGASFVGNLWTDGRSFDAVNEAYAKVPITTEQIVDPDRYRSNEVSLDVEDIEIDLEGYELAEEGTWGQVAFAAMFDQSLDAAIAQEAARGWGGDRYGIWFDGNDVVFVSRFAGDSMDDNTQMLETWRLFVEDQVPEATFTFSDIIDDNVWFVAAPDADTGALVTAVILR